MRRSILSLYKTPKNIGVAPRFDQWNDKYEPWEHMKRMGRLVGTGFYIPPEWYNHFRMFPPINHNFQQEKTLNPHNKSEPTGDSRSSLTDERLAIREELSRKSRLLASEGMRYYNIFWIQKPLDRMEKKYFELTSKGVRHNDAIKKVLESFYDEITTKKRVAAIQSEEAKLSGKFISMREALVVMNILTHLQTNQISPHQASLLAKEQAEKTFNGPSFIATIKSTPGKSEGDLGVSPESLVSMLGEENDEMECEVNSSTTDHLNSLKDIATDLTGSYDWYSGSTPVISGSDATD